MTGTDVEGTEVDDLDAHAMQSVTTALLAATVLQRRGWRMAQSMRNRCDWLIEHSEAQGLEPMEVARWNFKTRGVR